MGPKRHETYYGYDIVIQVEDTLFRVPRFPFLQSEVFRDMLAMPQEDQISPEGTNDDHPLRLEGYLADDFEHLLRVLLPQGLLPGQRGHIGLLSEQWMSVLKLATVWDFAAIRTTAIDALKTYGNNDPVLRIIVAKKFNIPEWFVPAVNSLARRKEVLTDNEIERLCELGSIHGVFRFFKKLSVVRESFHEMLKSMKTPTCVGCQEPFSMGRRDGECRTHRSIMVYCAEQLEAAQKAMRRQEHNFKQEIVKVFQCTGRGSVPDEAMWDFT